MTSLLMFLLVWSVKLAVAVLVGAALLVSLRKRSAATRHLVWRVVFAVSVLLPLGMLGGPRITAPVVPSGPVSELLTQHPSPQAVPETQQDSGSTSAALAHSAGPDRPTMDPWAIASVIYFAGAALILLRWLAGLRKIKKLSAGASPFQSSGDGRTLVVHDPVLKVPVTFGSRRPFILLPIEAPEWPSVRLSAALLHEEAHIRRHDWAVQSLCTFFCAVHWFNPAVWILAAKLRSTAEDAADDEVLAAGVQPTAYASALLDVAAAIQRPIPSGLGMVRHRGVAGRLRSILATSRDRRRPGRPFGWSVGIAMLSVGALVGALGFAQNAPALRQDETQENPVTASFAPGKPFYGPARLRNGNVLKVAFVQSDSKGGHEIWKPDGSPAPRSDLNRSLGMLSNPGQTSPYRRIYVRVDSDRPRGDTTYEVRVPHRSEWSVWQSYGDGKRDLDMVTFHAPKSLMQTDFKLGVASGLYHVHSSAPVGTGSLHPVITPYENEGAVAGDWVAPNLTAIVRIPKDAEGKDISVALHTRDNRKLELKVYETENTVRNGFPTRSYSFGGANPDEIVSVDLLVRDYEWVTFRGLRLYPKK